jgi:hypothetical protein
MYEDALQATKDQLEYWRLECEAAHRTGDTERIARCERFIQQCELVISVLERRRQQRQ